MAGRLVEWMAPLTIAVAVLDCATPARAGEPTYLRAGDPAPHDGELVPSPLLRRLLKADAGRRTAEGHTRAVRAELVRVTSDLVAERAQREADRAETERRDREWSAALERCEGIARESVRPSSVWSNPYLWGAVGLAVGVVVGVGLAGAL
jgi:hypothetical protein